jgi:hypothetical protein
MSSDTIFKLYQIWNMCALIIIAEFALIVLALALIIIEECTENNLPELHCDVCGTVSHGYICEKCRAEARAYNASIN